MSNDLVNKSLPMQPSITMPTEKDSAIKRVNLNSAEIGSRPSSLPKNTRNDMTVVHVSKGK